MKKQKKQLLELAKQAYNSSDVCQQWKDKILEVCPEFKPTLEIGRWYTDNKNYLMVWNGGKSTYGFYKGEYRYDWSFMYEDNKTPATDKEVEEALIKEAKKRGLWNNPNIKCLCLGEKNTTQGLNQAFCIKQNSMWTEYGEIFKNGKWAEIISEPVKKMTVSEICKELGYEVEIIKD